MGFSKDFIWGAAASAYQIEGAVSEDGKGLNVWDAFCRRPGKVLGGHTGEVACDHYHRYQEDVRLMAALGVRNYRFSINWSRVLPEGTGAVCAGGLGFYDRLIDAMLEKGIRPWMTLFHWEYPVALQSLGAWENPDSPQWFADFAALAARRYGLFHAQRTPVLHRPGLRKRRARAGASTAGGFHHRDEPPGADRPRARGAGHPG